MVFCILRFFFHRSFIGLVNIFISYLESVLCSGSVKRKTLQKLDQKAVKMRFVGYSLTQKRYRLYDENRQRIFIRKDVTFNEIDFGSTKAQMKCDEDSTECAEEEMELKGKEVEQILPKDPRRSGRERNPPVFYHDEYAGITTAKYAALHVAEIEEPKTLIKRCPKQRICNRVENSGRC